MLALKIVFLVTFVMSWVYSRKSDKAATSDIFVLAMLAILAPYFLFNPAGHSALYEQEFTSHVVLLSEIGVLWCFFIGTLIVIAQGKFGTSPRDNRVLIETTLAARVAWTCISISVLLFALFMIFSEFREFRLATTRFLLGDLSGEEYKRVRGIEFSGSLMLDGIIGRLRYTLLPVLCVIPLLVFLQNKAPRQAASFLMLFFIALPMSLSKMPIVFYIGYFATALAAVRNGISLKQLLAAAALSLAVVIGLLSMLYVFQYYGAVMSGSINPLVLALERIWGEPYSVILRYFSVYPDKATFTGMSGINLLAKTLGIGARLPDLEVATLALGPNSGSNPGVFFLGGYAAFGFTGLAIFSALGFGVVWALDEIANSLKTDLAYRTYMTVMPINCLFLVQVALQTSLLTYGVAVVPLIILIFDRGLLFLNRRRRSAF